jgi:hypothetical protein
MSKSKKELRRELRECRAALGRATASAGVCTPASDLRVTSRVAGDGSFVSRAVDEVLRRGVRYEDPGYRGDRERLASELEECRVARRHAEETRDALGRGKEKAERERDEALRHVAHHHAQGGAFTLIREVSPQVARINEGLRAANEDLRRINRELLGKLAELDADTEADDGEWHDQGRA